jgi:hypothetical protein
MSLRALMIKHPIRGASHPGAEACSAQACSAQAWAWVRVRVPAVQGSSPHRRRQAPDSPRRFRP